jgi:8-oxo-dGTP pyrophosphatase MutT (NUDIX family)
MLVRDDPDSQVPDLQVFVLRRTLAAVFVAGATVFPGGAVDPADDDVAPYLVGMDEPAAARELGLESGGLARRVAAVRECFEEAGILLARDRESGEPAPPLPAWRDAVNAGHATLAQVLANENLVVDARDLRVFSHWLTPLGAPRRYDTWFFVAPAPEGHEGEHDDSELVASEWVRPRDALQRFASGEIELIFPTMRSLDVLTRFASAADLLAALDGVPHDDAGRVAVVGDATGERVLLPGDDPGHAFRWTHPLPDIDARLEAQLATPRSTA